MLVKVFKNFLVINIKIKKMTNIKNFTIITINIIRI